tara:strand:+ start:582 stop:1739 length:1158 start_codon:yes stop_codon:yes gene_type:complete
MTCPLTNQGRMLNFIDSLSKVYRLEVFCIDDGQEIQIKKANITYHKFKIHSNIYSRFIKHTFFWRYNIALSNVVLKNLEEKDVDLIICHDLPTLMPAIALRKKLDSRLLYDSLEIYTETINQFFPNISGVKKVISSILIKFMRKFGSKAENRMMFSCDIITTVNESLANYFETKYQQQGIHVVMNCPKLSKPFETEINFRNKFDLKTTDTIFLYQGVLNEGRGLSKLIDAFSIVVKSNGSIKLIILGDGVLKNQLKTQVLELNLEQTVFFHKSVPYKNLLHFTKAADFGINLLEAYNLSKKLASPNKLFEYLQAEIPVLCSYSPENNIVMNDFNIGIQCENDVNSISKGIFDLSGNYQLNINEFIKAKKRYCWENQEKKLLNIVK